MSAPTGSAGAGGADVLHLTNKRIHVKMGVVWCCYDDSDDYYLNLNPDEGWPHFADCFLTNRGWCIVYQYPIIPSVYSTTPEQFKERITSFLNGKTGATETRVYWPTREEKRQIRAEFATASSQA